MLVLDSSSTLFFSEHIVHIAIDKTAVVAALGSVRIGSTASKSTRTGGTGNANAVSANPIVGTTETPVRPAAEIPVTIPSTSTSTSLYGVNVTSNKFNANIMATILYIIFPMLDTNKLNEAATSD